jgi:hypothetical protein
MCRLLVWLALLSFTVSCSSSDDVVYIFTGKTWKLTFIANEGSTQQVDYWGNQSWDNSMNLLKQPDNFTITFTGAEMPDESTQGTFKARGAASTPEGKWTVAAGSRNLTMSSSTGTAETDVLAKAFVNALQHTVYYSGDSNNLYIYFKEGQWTRYLALYPVK